jgi:hypothetical protein
MRKDEYFNFKSTHQLLEDLRIYSWEDAMTPGIRTAQRLSPGRILLVTSSPGTKISSIMFDENCDGASKILQILQD